MLRAVVVCAVLTPSLWASAQRPPSTERVTAATRAARNLDRFFDVLKEKLALVREIVRLVREVPAKRAELRAKRAQPAPIDTGFDPARYRSAAGQAQLLRKAEVYAGTAKQHEHDLILVNSAELHPETHALLRFSDGLGDSAYHTGQYLAALAYRFAVTGSPENRDALLRVLAGVYNLMTLTSDTTGTITDPRTRKVVRPRPGLPLRGYGNIASPLVKEMGDLAPSNASVYVFEGTPFGLPRGTYHLSSDISRDQMDGLFLGLAAAFEALRKHDAAPEWRKRISDAVVATMREFVKNGFKFIELNGRPTEFGDQSQMLDPTKLMHTLAWLGTAVAISGDAGLKKAYNDVADRHFGKQRVFKAALYRAALDLLRPLLSQNVELVGYVVSTFNYNLLAIPAHLLVRHAPDAKLRAVFLDIVESLVWPLLSDRRVPFFDFVYMAATGKRDAALIDRAVGTLGQFRERPFPFGNPASTAELVTDFSGRAELHDPLFFHLREAWRTKLARLLPKQKENPFEVGGSAWPLGPGLVPRSHDIERADPYGLKGQDPYAWTWTGDKKNLRQYPGHDYLLSYWFGRFHGLVAGGSAVSLEPVKERAKSTAGRIVEAMRDLARLVLDTVKRFVANLVHRLESYAKCVQNHVKPLAAKLAAELRAKILEKVGAFFGDLGPSLTALTPGDRHAVVDFAWQELRQAVRDRAADVRRGGADQIAGWFSSGHRAQAGRELEGAFDADAARLESELDALYQEKMR
jgi:hypothetical protein